MMARSTTPQSEEDRSRASRRTHATGIPTAKVVSIDRASLVGSSWRFSQVDWLLRTSGRVVDLVHLHENNVTVSQAFTLGWSALCGVLRGWGAFSREDLTVWLREHGYPGAQPGNHITARAPEHLLHRASGVDARVSLLEAAFVTIVLRMGRQGRESGRVATGTMPSMPNNRTAERTGEVDWSQLDVFSLEELFLLQVPMLPSCPHFLRNRLRECFGFAFRERSGAKVVADVEAEVCEWKLFGLIPMMLLHKPGAESRSLPEGILGAVDPPSLCGTPSTVHPARHDRRGRACTSREGSAEQSPDGTSA